MKAHIAGSGFGRLAAAAFRNAGALGQDITIYEADDKLGGGFFVNGNPANGYNLPAPSKRREMGKPASGG